MKMRILYTILFIIGVIGHSVQAQEASKQLVRVQYVQQDSSYILGTPELILEEQFHDFGQIIKGEKPKHTFEIFNRGTAPLKIDMVSACECTELDWTRSLIYPGEKGHILAQYDSTEKIGEQEVTLDIIAYKMLPGQQSPKEEEILINQARFRAFVKESAEQ